MATAAQVTIQNQSVVIVFSWQRELGQIQPTIQLIVQVVVE